MAGLATLFVVVFPAVPGSAITRTAFACWTGLAAWLVLILVVGSKARSATRSPRDSVRRPIESPSGETETGTYVDGFPAPNVDDKTLRELGLPLMSTTLEQLVNLLSLVIMIVPIGLFVGGVIGPIVLGLVEIFVSVGIVLPYGFYVLRKSRRRLEARRAALDLGAPTT